MWRWIARHRHLLLGWFWIAATIPTLIWFKDAVWLVLIMSIYANAEASFSAHFAKNAGRDNENDKKG